MPPGLNARRRLSKPLVFTLRIVQPLKGLSVRAGQADAVACLVSVSLLGEPRIGLRRLREIAVRASVRRMVKVIKRDFRIFGYSA